MLSPSGGSPSPAYDSPRATLVCGSCGFDCVTRVVRGPRLEVFEWAFDHGTRRVVWNVTGIREAFLSKGRPLDPDLAVTVTPTMAKQLLAMNPTGIEDGRMLPEDITPEPMVWVQHPSDVPGVFPLLPIDGWHRMEWSVRTGHNVQAILLPRAVELGFRILDEKL